MTVSQATAPRVSAARILEGAAQLFHTQGYAATSMRDLARAVGLQPSSLYSHFESKEDLLWTLAMQCAEAFQTAVAPVAQSDMALKPRLREMMVRHVEVVIAQRKLARIFTEEWQYLSEPRRRQYAAARDQYEGLFRDVFRQGVEAYSFTELEEKFASLTLLSALNWTYTWYRPEGEYSPREIGEKLADLLLHGLIRKV